MWRTVKLGDVCDFQGGSQPPKKEFVFEPQDGYIRFLQIRDFKSDKNVTFIPISKKNRLCNTDDILIGRYGASVGQILRGLEGAYNVALMKTIPNVEMISKGWLYSYLNSPLFQKPLIEVSSRSAQNGFSKDDISGFELPLPPLAEQQRIVAKLDAAFAEIDKGIELVETKQANAEKLKASLLDASLKGDDAMWKTVKLGELFDVGSSKRVLKADWQDKGIPFYRGREITALSANDYVDNDLFITEEHYQSLLSKYGVPNVDDIMITAIGTIGNTYIVQPNQKFYFKDASVLWLRKKTDVSSNYIKYWLKSNQFFCQLDKGNGATVDTLTIKKLASVVLPLPPLAEQQRIVAKLDAAFTEIANILATTTMAKENYIALKSTMLAQELNSSEAA